jgi:2-oxoisovalerate ferredoxin oxidoreductase alpha subunit
MIKFVKGNEAVVIGALYAGCDAYFGYPITPASEIVHAASEWFPRLNRVFLQAECETASINMVYGAAAAGVLSMTASSGPGMSLMQEGLSYMAGAHLPGVIVDISRAGPGLGNVYPEQADYNQAVKGGGHGNYTCIVLAPGNVQEMCDLTMKAFELSVKHRNPAIVLADAVLGQMMETLKLPAHEIPQPDTRGWAAQGTAETRKNLITSIFLDAQQQSDNNEDLQKKYAAMRSEAMHECYRCDDAEVVLAAYGVSSRVARTAVDALREQGVKAGLFRPLTLAPFPREALCAACAGAKAHGQQRVVAVELSAGQFRDDVAFHLAEGSGQYKKVGLVHRMGGVLLSVEDVVDAVKQAGKEP